MERCRPRVSLKNEDDFSKETLSCVSCSAYCQVARARELGACLSRPLLCWV